MAHIYVSRSLLNGFVRRAKRRLPKEYIESVWGRSGRNGETQVCSFQKIDHEATDCNITDWDETDIPNGEAWGPLVCLGTIHSHPIGSKENGNPETSPSEDDWDFYSQTGELVSGICSLWKENKKTRSRVRWFFSQAILDVKYGR